LSMEDFERDRDDVVRRASERGVSFVEVGFDVESSVKAVSLARRLRGKCTVGIHPGSVPPSRDGLAGAWKQVEALLDDNPEIAAIGEIGLDFSRGRSAEVVQVECFAMGLALARKKGLPVVIHQRDAAREVLCAVKDLGTPQPAVFHCFTGDRDYAARCLDLGGYLGLGGILTFPKNIDLRETVRYLPRDRILLETDSPYLAPQSQRGKRNEPSFVTEVRDLVAGLLGLPAASVSEMTAANASRAFLAELATPGK